MKLRELADLIWHPDAPPEVPHDGKIPLKHVSREMMWQAAARIFRAGKLAGRREALALVEAAAQRAWATSDGDRMKCHQLNEVANDIIALPPPTVTLDTEVGDA